MIDPDAPLGPYDAPPIEEEDLWFLPAPPPPIPPDAHDIPLPQAPREAAFAADRWAQAEREVLPDLLEATAVLARLEERLAHAPAGAFERLALREVADLMRQDAGWIGVERLALFRALRAATGEDAQALIRADWALRRLLDPPAPIHDLGAFLGLNRDDMAPHPGWLLSPLEAPLHPITRMAAIYAGGRGGWDEAVLEPVIVAMRAANPARFAPVGLGMLRGGGDPAVWLSAWCAALMRSATAALLHLTQITDWYGQARAQTSDLSGRTPERLIAALIKAPVVSAPMASQMTGASRAACLRNLTLFAERGLIRETTGQGRYRFWAIA